ncbi:hypothetical protein GCM10010372_03780 [Streptomyces tauricus]|nr:hypothetical protein GCM10010372_03780 [Streptomyces tauricus]
MRDLSPVAVTPLAQRSASHGGVDEIDTVDWDAIRAVPGITGAANLVQAEAAGS